MTDSGFYQTLEKASSFFLLNFLWLIACLPLVTFFPATVAMFAVVRNWHGKEDYQVFFPFWRSFGAHFKPKFIMGIVWLVIGGMIIFNYRSIVPMPHILQIVLFTVNTFVALVYSATTVFLYPLLAHFRLSPILAIKLAFVLSLQQLRTTGLCALAVALVVSLALIIPITLLITGSVLAYTIFSLTSQKFPESTAFPVQS